MDLDGTLAESWPGEVHDNNIGKPVPEMLERVKAWVAGGQQVKIVTARADRYVSVQAVRAWCKKHVGIELEVTDRKDFDMIQLWDDRAVRVERNTGKVIGGYE